MNPMIFESILSILPAVIVALTALIVMITIAVKRSHFWAATLSVVGLNMALLAVISQALGLVPAGVSFGELFIFDGFAIFNMGVILIAALACCTAAWYLV